MTRRARAAAPLRTGPTGAQPDGPFLSFVSLGVGDLDRAVRFYTDALGCAASRVTKEMAMLDAGPVRLALLTRPALAREAGFKATPERGPAADLDERQRPPFPGAVAGLLLSFNVERRADVAMLLARAESAGGRIVRKAARASWGGEAGVLADPDGFLWEIAWNPRLSRAGWGRRRGSRRPAPRSR